MLLRAAAAGAGAAEPGLQTRSSSSTTTTATPQCPLLRCSTPQPRHDARRRQLTRCSSAARHATSVVVTAAATTSATATRAAAASATATVAVVHDLLTHVGHQRRSSSSPARHQPCAPPLGDLQLQHSDHVRLQQQLAHLHRRHQQQLEQQQQLEHQQQQQEDEEEEEQQHARHANGHSLHALTTDAAAVTSSHPASSSDNEQACSSLQQQQQSHLEMQRQSAAPAVLRMHGRSKPVQVAAALCTQLQQQHGGAEVLLCVAGAELALAALHALAFAADALQQQEQGRVQLQVVPHVRRSKRPDGRGRCLTFDFACRVHQLSHDAAAAAGDAAEEQSAGQQQQEQQEQHAQQRHHVLAVAQGHHAGHDCVTAAAAVSSRGGGQRQQQQLVLDTALHHHQQPVLPCCGALAAAGLQQPLEHHANGHAGTRMLHAVAAGVAAVPACCSSSNKSLGNGSSVQPLAWPGHDQVPGAPATLPVHEQQQHASHQPLQLHHALPVVLQQQHTGAAAVVEAVHVAAATAAGAAHQQQQQQQEDANLVQAIKVCSTSMNLADALDGALSSSAAVTLAVTHPKQAVKAVEAVALVHKRWQHQQQQLPGQASSGSGDDSSSCTLAAVMSPCWARGRKAGAAKRGLQLYVYAASASQ